MLVKRGKFCNLRFSNSTAVLYIYFQHGIIYFAYVYYNYFCICLTNYIFIYSYRNLQISFYVAFFIRDQVVKMYVNVPYAIIITSTKDAYGDSI